jgi:hypothetical protein
MSDRERKQLRHELDQFLFLAEDVTDPLATSLVGDVIEELQGRLKEASEATTETSYNGRLLDTRNCVAR